MYSVKPNLAVRVRVGLRLGLGKSLFSVGRAKDQTLPAGPTATSLNVTIGAYEQRAKQCKKCLFAHSHGCGTSELCILHKVDKGSE